MKRAIIILFACVHSYTDKAQSPVSPLQQQAIDFVEKNKGRFISWSNSTWNFAEPPFHEIQSVALFINILKENGFTVQENIRGHASLFVATYGNAKPVIGLFAEYDADSGASNKTVPRKEPLLAGGYGHGGAHNLLGVGSIATALAMKELISQGKLKATIRLYGSTSEGKIGTRAWLAKDGYFNDLDISLYWHPAPVSWASTGTWDALIDLDVVAPSPAFIDSLEKLKSSTTPAVTFKYERDKILIQCAYQTDANNLFEKIKQLGGRIKVNRAMHQFLPNITAMKMVHANMEKLGAIKYNNDEIDFSLTMQQYVKAKTDTIKDLLIPFREMPRRESLYGYASDIGEASWIAPEIYFVVKCFPSGVAMHSWQGTAFTAHSIGHKGMIHAAKLMSMSIIDYIQNKKLQQAIQQEFLSNTQQYKYKPIIQN